MPASRRERGTVERMRLSWVLVGAMACGNGQPPVTPPSDAPDEPDPDAAIDIDAGTVFPTESRELGLGDISLLVRLPADPVSSTTFARMTGFPGGAELVARDVFARLVTDPGDVGHAYEEFHIVALRFDLCERFAVGTCPIGADGQLRIVLQPVFSGNGIEAADVALHAHYPIPADELAIVVNELRALARLQNFQTAAPLSPNETLSSTAPPTAYSLRLRKLVAKYASAERLTRLALFAQNAQTNSFNWVFRGVDIANGNVSDIVIPTIAARQQRTIFTEPRNFFTTPVADVPTGFQLALQRAPFLAASFAEQTQALSALAIAQNPTLQTVHTEQCVACHVSTFLVHDRAQDIGVDPATIPETYSSQRNLSIAFGGAAGTSISLRAFGWFHGVPMISQRVVNETAAALDEIDERFPPADETIFLDAGVPDAAPLGKRVFTTNAQYTGDLRTVGAGVDGLDGGDKLCASAAMNAGLGAGPWVAWLSTSTVNAIDRITSDGPWYLSDGTTLVFQNKAAILDGPAVPIDRDEHGGRPAGADNIKSGTLATGLAAPLTCNDWTSSAFNVAGLTGLRSSTDAEWTQGSAVPCSVALSRLYCFEL